MDLTQIEHNLQLTRAAVTEVIEAMSDAPAQDAHRFADGRAKRAVILYRAAEGGAGSDKSLLTVATALELLELGLAKHFSSETSPVFGAPPANLALIAADRYYAKALALVVSLRDDRLVRVLCGALAAASEGYSRPQQAGAAERRNALAAAATRLGCLLAGRGSIETSSSDIDEEVNSAIFPNPS